MGEFYWRKDLRLIFVSCGSAGFVRAFGEGAEGGYDEAAAALA